jgi:glycosyltransferase involved in cell wall biosynthesis
MIVVNAKFLTQKITGVQRFAIEISRLIKEKLGQQLFFLTPGNVIHNELAAELGAITYGKNKGAVWEQLDLKYYLIAHGRPLLINFCNTGVLFYRRQIVTIHDMSYKVNPKWFSKSFYYWYNFLIPNISKYSKRILTVSNSSKRDLVNYLKIDQEKISVVYNSSSLVANDNFEGKSANRYFLTVSSLDTRKNLQSLITAFNQINEDVNLFIVGVKDSNFVFNMDEHLFSEKIVLKGYVDDADLKVLMTNATAFVYVSLYEGFGLPPLEAMSMGCPVIVSDIAAHREVCGNAALYVNPFDIAEITKKIKFVLQNDKVRIELAEAGKINAKRFNWLNSAEKVIKIINEVL